MSEKIKSHIALKAGLWYTISNFMLKALNFISIPIFARILSQEEYGLYNNYLSWFQILSVVITMNLAASLISAKYDYNNAFDNYLANMMQLTALISFCCIVFSNCCFGIVSKLINVEQHILNILLIYVMFSACLNLFLAREKFLYHYKKSTVLSFSVSLINILLSLALIRLLDNHYLARVIGGATPVIIVGSFLLLLYVFRNGKIDTRKWKYAICICLPYIPHSLSLIFLNSMDKIQITNICGAGDNAIYSMAYSVGAVVTLLLSSMNEAYVPWFADQLSVGNEKEIRKVGKIYQTAFAIGAIGIMLVAPEVLYLLGGEKYSVAKNVLAPVTMGCVFQFFYTMYVNLEQAKKKTVGMAIGSISAAVLNYILNALFIPRFGYIAAAYTTVASYLWLYIIHVILVARLGYLRVYDLRYEIAILCFAMITCIGINLLYDIFFGRLIVIFIYSILLTVVLIIKKDIILSFVKRIRTRG